MAFLCIWLYFLHARQAKSLKFSNQLGDDSSAAELATTQGTAHAACGPVAEVGMSIVY